ncbi:TonB-dependent receptor [Acetobacter nitrogenifigens DSM 23921 = NBRC 105050]|uniref:Ligand-gated channel n=1 Tax=Acetobacter nitrogenifigens DSM 23921 = NBRC 105050 TaxID=1120919 RepID=A0A511X8P8_9PROT|nr:TonB-dependent receptor plug domain-containing protein [Acetobacter nitrogenifigens]GBQ87619.1 TonB-dependent receptor [Acetobacter nitrogenifigens DSM 23921 = NBRC 105050]GEN59301.1 ligand-gated channel [Acetobacter nitrogenifigens DSM 23921 = NBRC 105050]
MARRTCVRLLLLATTCVTVIHVGHARAEDVVSPLQDREERITVKGGTASANGVTNTTPGGGMMPRQTAAKAISGVSRDFIAKQSPTTNALTMLKAMPGVIVASVDPLGTSDRMNVSIRGLNQTEIGTTFEGMPVGDKLYYSPFTSEWSDTENLGFVDVAQGAPDISAPVYNSVGGQINAGLRNPSDHFGGLVDVAGGTKAVNREFLRVDTGLIGKTGTKGYISFSHSGNDNWRGTGGQTRYHVDARAVKEWGDDNRIAPFLSWNLVQADLFTNPTLAQWNQYKDSYNYSGTYSFGNTAYQKFHFYRRQTVMLAAPSRFSLTPNLKLSVTPYFMYTHGIINGASVLNDSSVFYGNQAAGPLNLPYSVNGKTTVENVDPYTQFSAGQNAYLTWTQGRNTLQFGYWYDYFDHNEASSYSVADFSGNVRNSYGHTPVLTSGGDVLRSFDGHIIQQINALFISDTMKFFHDRLTLNAGFKEVMVSRSATSMLPGSTYAVTANDAVPLPQFSASYKITQNDQVYINGSTAFREPASINSYVDIFNSSTGKMSSTHSSNLKPEYSISEEIGYRHYGLVNASVAFFNYNFTNRQVSTSALVNGTPETSSLNAGGQTSRGVQAEVGLRPWRHFSPYVSGQYLHATIDNNFAVSGDLLPTKGKTAVLSPKFSGSIGLSYDDGSMFGNFALTYVGSQYTTFMNDQHIPGYETANMTLGYRFKTVGPAKHPQIQLNLINIGNEKYLSGAYGVTPNARTTRGVYGTSLSGSSPTYYVGAGFAAVVSLSSGF